MTARPEVLAATADRIATELGMSADRAWEMPMEWYMVQVKPPTYENGSDLRIAVLSLCHANDLATVAYATHDLDESHFYEVAPRITGELVRKDNWRSRYIQTIKGWPLWVQLVWASSLGFSVFFLVAALTEGQTSRVVILAGVCVTSLFVTVYECLRK